MSHHLAQLSEVPFWPAFTWREFRSMRNKENRVVLIPVCGFNDWKLGYGLDTEEILLSGMLEGVFRGKLAERKDDFLVVPFIRFTLGGGNSFFHMSFEDALQLLKDVVVSIKASGFQRCCFVNLSPWNSPLIDLAGRDFRQQLDLQMFSINGAGLGVDLLDNDPVLRSGLVNLLKEFSGREPSVQNLGIPQDNADPAWGSLRFPICSTDSSWYDSGASFPEKDVLSQKTASLLEEIHAKRLPYLPV